MVDVNEVSEDTYRISIYVKDFDLQFNHFLVLDDEPLLYHAGMRKMFPLLYEGVSKIVDPSKIRWISWSHFEVDEVGGLNQWLQSCPNAQPACSMVGALVNLGDFSDKSTKGLNKGDVLETGKFRFRFHPTPHLPHGWDAGMLFEEKNKTLFCSDLFHQVGKVEPRVDSDIVLERTHNAIVDYQKGPLMDYVPYTDHTKRLLYELSEFNPQTLAIMHGSTYSGDGATLLKELEKIFKEVFTV
jgi:flavorubredoxin